MVLHPAFPTSAHNINKTSQDCYTDSAMPRSNSLVKALNSTNFTEQIGGPDVVMVAPPGASKEVLEEKIIALLNGSSTEITDISAILDCKKGRIKSFGIDVASLGSSNSQQNDFIKESDGQDSEKLLASNSSKSMKKKKKVD